MRVGSVDGRAGAIRLLGVAVVAAWALHPFAMRAQDVTPEADLASLTGAVTAAGSLSVAPMIQAAADAFTAEAAAVAIAIERSSSDAGLARFCAGETDLAISGRRMLVDEAGVCADAGVAFDEFAVGFDGIAVVVNPANDFVTCLSVDQLRRLWQPDSTVATWQDLDPAWPADPIFLHGTGGQSGAYQSFTQAIVGEEGASRDDYTVTPSHPLTAELVAANENALGFLPYPRYQEAQARLALVEVDGGEGCVAPTSETIKDRTYAPLSRPLYVYANRERLTRPEVAAFLRFAFARARGFAQAAGLVPFAEEIYAANDEELAAAIAGTSLPDGPRVSGTPAP
jgi:phosphate transport system substrate-binding protein